MSNSVMQEAHGLVYGDRQDDYGDAYEEAQKIAAGWGVILGVEIDPRNTALCLAWLKVCRHLNRRKRDNLVDLAGYAGVAEKIEAAYEVHLLRDSDGPSPESSDVAAVPQVRGPFVPFGHGGTRQAGSTFPAWVHTNDLRYP